LLEGTAESERWLKLIHRIPLIEPPEKMTAILNETEELIKIFATSIRTAQNNCKKR
jgi:four helix bundle protein